MFDITVTYLQIKHNELSIIHVLLAITRKSYKMLSERWTENIAKFNDCMYELYPTVTLKSGNIENDSNMHISYKNRML